MRLPSCPPEFKILIADRITAYHMYVQAHARLHQAKSKEEVGHLAQTVLNNYNLNRLIWRELEHYKRTNTILGEHPIFEVTKFMVDIKKLPIQEVIKKRNSLYKSIKVAQKQLRENKEPHLRESREKLVNRKTPLLEAVEKYLSNL